MLQTLLDSPYLFKIVASIVLIAVALAIRTMLIRTVLKGAAKSELRRGWIVNIRNATWLIIALGLAAVWAEAIESFGTAILAVAVAFVIATKELIQGVMGNFVRTTTNMYSVGDRIEVGSHRGDVVDLNLFSTTILEVGPGKTTHLRTGRTIIVPNLKLLDTVVVNESSMKQYVVHSFAVPISLRDNWKKAESVLLSTAETECAPFLGEAREHMNKIEREHGLKGLPLKPRVLLEYNQPDRINLLVRVPAPVGRQGSLEQAVIRRFLEDASWRVQETARDAGPAPRTS
jgi:small-conductance mechanosensitive channel